MFICVDKTLRFNENPCEGWGHLLINILIRHWLAEQKMLVLFWCLVLWILLPSSCVWVPQLQTDRGELSKHTCQVSQAYPVCVSNVGWPRKEEPCSWKTTKLLTFCLLRSLWRNWYCGPRCLVLVTWVCWMIFLYGEAGDLGRGGTIKGWLQRRSTLCGGVAVWQGG